MSGISEDEAFIEVIWKIKNFSCCKKGSKQSYGTGTLKSHLKKREIAWMMSLFPKGVLSYADKFISIRMHLFGFCDDSGWPFKTEYSLLDTTNKPRHSKQSVGNCDEFVERNFLFNNKDIFFPHDVLTLRCRMTYEGIVSAQNISVFTTVPIVRSSATWKIKNFENCDSSSCAVTFPVCDDIFTQPAELTLRYKKNQADEWIQFSMKHGNHTRALYLKSRIFLPELSEIDVLYVLDERHLRDPTWSIKPLITQENLVQKLKQASFKGTFKAKCEFMVVNRYEQTETICGDHFLKMEQSENLHFFTTDIQQMYKKGIFSDLQLRVQSESYRVHASILAARSPVFLSMLECDMAEKKSRTIVIDDLEPETCSRMLDYFYSADPGVLDVSMSCKLYYAGDKYQVPGLKAVSSKFLRRNCSLENVFDVLLLADRHQDEDLKGHVIDYLVTQKDFLTEENLQSLMEQNLKLAVEMTLKVIKSK